LLSHRPDSTSYKNLVDSAQALVMACRKIGVDPEEPANRVRSPRLSFAPFNGSVLMSEPRLTSPRALLSSGRQVYADKILDYRIDAESSLVLSPEIAKAIESLWQDPVIADILNKHSSEFYLMDSAT
jgi:guanine nucleotide-binding protein G(i) subunit alpha